MLFTTSGSRDHTHLLGSWLSALPPFPQASDHEAKLSAALWHRASQVDVRVSVSVSEKHIETLFCQKMDTTDGKFTGKSKKVPTDTDTCTCRFRPTYSI